MEVDKGKKNKWGNKGVIAIIGGLWAILIAYNIYSQKAKFFEIPIYHVLSLMVAVGVAYYLVQKKNDIRKQKEMIEKTINKIQLLLSEVMDEKNWEQAVILNLNRQINNKINILSQYAKYEQGEITYIKEQFREIKEYIGANIVNLEKLDWALIRVKVNNIENKCDRIIMGLYFEEVVLDKR